MAPTRSGKLLAEYVLPLKWQRDDGLPELVAYLERLCTWIDVTVVDGSDPDLFANHARRIPAAIRHLAPAPWPGRNGKVAGVMTGVRNARHERIVIADDDVRYDFAALERVLALLENAHIVRPQNYFAELPWHARLDTARSLINRAICGDYPGTLAVSRSKLLEAGGYDGDVLFENLELIRTIRAAGGTEARADDVFVARLPPPLDHFARQRVRQAYDDFAQPGRLGIELAVLPLMIAATRKPSALLAAGLLPCLIAEVGRRRSGGRAVFPATSALWAPLWVLERAVCVWFALAQRITGGARYAGQRIRRAGTPLAILKRKAGTS